MTTSHRLNTRPQAIQRDVLSIKLYLANSISTAFRKFGDVFERETQHFHRGTAPLAITKAPTGRFRYLSPLGEPAVTPRTPTTVGHLARDTSPKL